MTRRLRLASLLACTCVPAVFGGSASADPPCGGVEVRMKPGAGYMQMVVWIEDAQGKYVDTAYITRVTGQFGLGNRPGTPLLKTDFGWPYGRREMVAPVWAFRRNHHYPKIVMGGACGNSPDTRCKNGQQCLGNCDDTTIAYHSLVSSYEPFYCDPTGGVHKQGDPIDVLSCASKGSFSKGAYLPFPGTYSLYPPRADQLKFDGNVDSPDLMDFAKENDLVAVSQATPPAGKPIDPPVSWFPQNLPGGDYVMWVEMSQEADFNGAHNHPNQPDSVMGWDFEGHPFLGQPSVVYKVPFHFGGAAYSNIATQYAGYGRWDGTDGTLHPPDGTITVNQAGTGAGRLVDVNDGIDVYRVKVVVGDCGGPPPDGGMADMSGVDMYGMTPPDFGVPPCLPPLPAEDLAVSPSSGLLSVSFRGATSGPPANRFAVRYREGTTPITDDEFDTDIAAPSVSAGLPGELLTVDIKNLIARTSYAVAVRGVSPCNKPSRVVSQVVKTEDQHFTTLNGCFVATAAWGSPMERQVQSLRRFRDRHLLDNPAGRLFVAAYYAFAPPLANVIRHDERLRAAARVILQPLVDAATLVTR